MPVHVHIQQPTRPRKCHNINNSLTRSFLGSFCFVSPKMALFVRQVWTLILKNLLIAFVRRWFTTTIRAFLLPCIFVGFLCVPIYTQCLPVLTITGLTHDFSSSRLLFTALAVLFQSVICLRLSTSYPVGETSWSLSTMAFQMVPFSRSLIESPAMLALLAEK